jgi:hypothetical protein
MTRLGFPALGLLLLAVVAGCGTEIQPDPDPTDRVGIQVSAEFRLAENQETFRAAAVELGAPQDEQRGMPPERQAVIVKVDWTDSPIHGGWFHLIAFDKRVTPPRPLNGGGGWSAAGLRGPVGTSAYDPLAKRYDWLANLGWARLPDGSWTRPYSTPAVVAPASPTGTMTAWWFNSLREGNQPPLANPDTDAVLALIYEAEDGQLRWVKQING